MTLPCKAPLRRWISGDLTIPFRFHLSGFLPKPGENKTGSVTGENHFSPLPGQANHPDAMKVTGPGDDLTDNYRKKDVFRPSVLDMESGRRDRWRDEERDTNSSVRKDRWREGEREHSDNRRWIARLIHLGDTMGKHVVPQASDGQIQEAEIIMSNVVRANGTRGGDLMTKRLMLCVRSGGTPTKKMIRFLIKGPLLFLIMERMRKMWIIIDLGDLTLPTAEPEQMLISKLQPQTNRTTDVISHAKYLEGVVHVPSLTQEEPIEPLAFCAPTPEELVILKGIDRGEITSSGAPQVSKDGSAGRTTTDFMQSRRNRLEAMDFKEWCESECIRLMGSKDTSILEYCLKISRSEAETLLAENLASVDPNHEFIDKFLNYKDFLPADSLEIAFKNRNDRKTTASSMGDMISDNMDVGGSDPGSMGANDGASKGGKKKGKKGKKVSPSVLGFNVVSNRIMMGEIQTVDD
ncbi:UNVERIFIED_CONTAM: protein ESSENTIAL FOR POTEXVIRUS ACCUMULATION 1 [Sesamum radiatum]|uniref:Protein ESSENTIAL FOR POTEXVIRUS ACCUMULATION 1 n=1 Tax=Sesamum radiatum TaxID=300843 RepID=A0AAW2PZE2_SESRA